MTDVPNSPGHDAVRLGGGLLNTARSLVLTCILSPATDVAVEDPHGPAAAEARTARALLDRIGWPGEPATNVPLTADEFVLIRSAALAGLGAAAAEVDEAAAAVSHDGSAWAGDGALDELERVVALLDLIGWPGGSRRVSVLTDELAAPGVAHASIPDAVLVVGTDGTILAASPKFCALTGYSAEELVGATPPFPHWHEDDREQPATAASQFLGSTDRTASLVRYRHKNGASLTVRNIAYPIPGPDGEVSAHAVLVADESAVRVTRHALRTASERFRELADAVPVQLWTTDTRGEILFVNRAGLAFFEEGGASSIGRVVDRIHPEDRETAVGAWRAAIGEQRPTTYEVRLRRRDGEYRSLVVDLTPTVDDDGHVLGFVGAAVDVTEQKWGSCDQAAGSRVEEAMLRVAEAVTGGNGLGEVLTLVAGEAATLADVDAAAVVRLVEADRGVVVASSQTGPWVPGDTVAAGDAVVAHLMVGGHPWGAIVRNGSAPSAAGLARVRRFAVTTAAALAGIVDVDVAGGTGDGPQE